MKSIAFFNNKGGVGKTTLLCNLASYFSKKLNKNVLVIDADPQCNATSYVLDEDCFYSLYFNSEKFTVASLIPPLENGEGYVNTYEAIKTGAFGFDIIPGNPMFAVGEDFLALEWKDVKSFEVRGIKSTLLFSSFLSHCKDYDYVFFDIGPSLGAINRSVLLACDYFLTPMSSDVFSLLALKNIGKSLSSWRDMLHNGINNLDDSRKSIIRSNFQECTIKFVGYVEQQYIAKSVGGQRQAVRAYDEILKKIPEEIEKEIISPINGKKDNVDYKIGSIPNYHSLVPMSQTSHKPIFELVGEDGVVGAHYQKVKEFEQLMGDISQKLLDNMEKIK